jgi:hypothetical protein
LSIFTTFKENFFNYFTCSLFPKKIDAEDDDDDDDNLDQGNEISGEEKPKKKKKMTVSFEVDQVHLKRNFIRKFRDMKFAFYYQRKSLRTCKNELWKSIVRCLQSMILDMILSIRTSTLI